MRGYVFGGKLLLRRELVYGFEERRLRGSLPSPGRRLLYGIEALSLEWGPGYLIADATEGSEWDRQPFRLSGMWIVFGRAWKHSQRARRGVSKLGAGGRHPRTELGRLRGGNRLRRAFLFGEIFAWIWFSTKKN